MLASTSEAYDDPKVHPQPESYWVMSIPWDRGASTTRSSASRKP
jgi:hypothetical protein